jgi:hypothetical protein
VFGQHFAVPGQVVLLQGGGGGFGVKEAGKLGYEGFPLDMHVSTNQESAFVASPTLSRRSCICASIRCSSSEGLGGRLGIDAN